MRHGLEGAKNLATLYGQYCFLMSIDTEEYVYSMTEAMPASSHVDYYTKIRELHEASVAIQTCSLRAESFELVHVDTSGAAQV